MVQFFRYFAFATLRVPFVIVVSYGLFVMYITRQATATVNIIDEIATLPSRRLREQLDKQF